MNARELSQLLKRVSGILDLFGEKPLQDVLNEIDVLVRSAQEIPPAKKEVSTPPKAAATNAEIAPQVPPAVIEQMEQMNVEELQTFLRHSKMFKSKSSLLSLSKQLGVPASGRNNIPTIIHNLVKHFEFRRVDQMIQQR